MLHHKGTSRQPPEVTESNWKYIPSPAGSQAPSLAALQDLYLQRAPPWLLSSSFLSGVFQHVTASHAGTTLGSAHHCLCCNLVASKIDSGTHSKKFKIKKFQTDLQTDVGKATCCSSCLPARRGGSGARRKALSLFAVPHTEDISVSSLQRSAERRQSSC